MDRHELDDKIEKITKTLFSYCAARTPNQFEAEDLAQDILLEVYRCAEKIQSADTFYGFMWAVAGNVYKQWLRKRAKAQDCKLTENLSDESELLPEDDSAVYLLRRELSLLSRKYRKAVILYYIENKSCSEISAHLKISESMVKYLLFKSRKILKEGVNMERIYGQQSYSPKELSLLYWGNGANRYFNLCDSKISQNILFACYNDKLTAEQISLEIGVALPYMEDKLSELYEYDLLKKDGNRYSTNIVIFTDDFSKEVNVKTAELRERIASLLTDSITKQESAVRNIGFYGADMGGNSFAWQMACFVLYRAIVDILQNKIKITYPKDKFGTECFVWAAENGEHSFWESQFGFGISNAVNENGDSVRFMDFPVNGEMVHHYFSNHQTATNVFLDIAKRNTAYFSENDLAAAADMVRKGYVLSKENGLFVNTPVLTQEQHRLLRELFSESAATIASEAEALMETVTEILKNHVPSHLKRLAKDMAYLRLFEDAITAPITILFDQKFLLPYHGGDVLPTTYIILK